MIPNQNFYTLTPDGQQPQPQQYPQQALIPADFVYGALNTERCLSAAWAENSRLQHKLEKSVLRDEAFSKALELADCRTYVASSSGNCLLLMNQQVDQVLHVTPTHPFTLDPFYLIWFKNIEECVRLDEKAYSLDKKFLTALQEVPGLEITIRKSLKHTAWLLRDTFSRCLRIETCRFYEGWRVKDPESPVFRLFPNFSTHQKYDLYPYLDGDPVEPSSPALTAMAAKQFWPCFTVATNPFLRYVLFLWYHSALLHSLFRRLGLKFPLSLYIFTANADSQLYFQQLFSWFGDSPFSLDISPENFKKNLLARKDQPLLVLDQGHLTNAATNVYTLEEVLSTGEIKFNGNTRPLLAPLTIISSRTSAISCAPEAINLDILDEDFDRDLWLRMESQITPNADYLTAFAAYTQDHISGLHSAMEEGRKIASHRANGTLSKEYLATFGIFLGLSSFLKDFFHFAAPAIPPVDVLDESLIKQLQELLCCTSAKELCGGVVDQFIAIVRDQIQHGIIRLLPRNSPIETTSLNVCYADEDCIYFMPPVFRSVCRLLPQSQPVILRELADADLFRGRPTNSRTMQTRICIGKPSGKSQLVPVYALARSAFEVLGDPLSVEEEVM